MDLKKNKKGTENVTGDEEINFVSGRVAKLSDIERS